MRQTLISFICFFSLSLCIQAKENKTQAELRAKLETVTNNFEKIPYLLKLSVSFEADSPAVSLNYARQAKELALKFHNDTLLASVNLRLGNAQLAHGDFIAAKNSLEAALNIFLQSFEVMADKNIKKLDWYLAETYYNLGLVNYYLGNYDISFLNYQSALRKYIQLGNTQKEANVYQNMGMVLSEIDDGEKSLDYYLRSLALNRKLKNKTNVAGLTQNIGLYYLNKSDFKKAEDYLVESLRMYGIIEDKEGIATSYSNMGLLFQRQAKYHNAMEYYKKAYSSFCELNNKPGIILSLHNIGTSYSNAHDFKSALAYYNQSLSLAKEIGHAEAILANYDAISNLYYDMGDFKNSLENQTLYYQLKDSLSSLDVKKKIAEVESAYRLDLKEQELARKNSMLRQQIIQKYALFGCLLVVLLLILFVYLAYNRKRKAEKELKKHKKRLEIAIDEKTEELRASLSELKYAEESDRFKSAFMANMSHELRTPMNAIIAFANFLKDASLNDDKKNEYINYITTAGQTLLHLVDDIIDSAKLEARQLTINKTPCNITSLLVELREIFNQIKIKKSKENLEFKISIKSLKNDVIILTDPFRLKQILNNLLENAMKYTEEGYIEFGYTLQKDGVKFFVTDTGIGIPNDKFEFIFQRFSQIEVPSKNTFGGTGLGLSITKNLVELLNGKIWVESEVCSGSTFYFTIPVENLEISERFISVAPKQKIPEKDIKYEWPEKNILVAEDEELNFKVLESVLLRTKANILRARDGYEAVEVCNSRAVDLVLMDIQMPRMDGHNATKIIKENFPAMPVIAQTSFAMTGEREKCMESGCDDYLCKPLNLVELLMKINKFLQ